MRYLILTLFIFTSFTSFSQNDSVRKIQLTGYLESYYSYDFSRPINHEKPDFNYNYKKHNQLNINLAF